MLLFGPRSRSLPSSSLSTGVSNLAIAARYPQHRCVLSGGVSVRHILRDGFPKIFGNLLLKWQSSGAYMPRRSWLKGSIASSAVTSPLSLGQRGKWQRGRKDHYKTLLHSGTSLSTCMVQVTLLRYGGTGEEWLCPHPGQHPWVSPAMDEPCLGLKKWR